MSDGTDNRSAGERDSGSGNEGASRVSPGLINISNEGN